MYEWKFWEHDSCPECGGGMEVFTSAPEGSCYDGDTAKCMDCGLRTGISVDEDGTSWLQDP
jgi:hypothetical protein